jgi:hypothetical protein
VGLQPKEAHTGICLYAGGDFTRADVIKIGDILAENSLEVALANAPSGHGGRVDPSTHIEVSADEHTHAWIRGGGGDNSWIKTTSRN